MSAVEVGLNVCSGEEEDSETSCTTLDVWVGEELPNLTWNLVCAQCSYEAQRLWMAENWGPIDI